MEYSPNPEPDNLVGQILDERYEILSLASEGASELRYKARHLLMNRFVEIRMLKSSMTTKEGEVDRFKREVAALQTSPGSNSVSVLDSSITANGQPYFVINQPESDAPEPAGSKTSSWPTIKVMVLLAVAVASAAASLFSINGKRTDKSIGAPLKSIAFITADSSSETRRLLAEADLAQQSGHYKESIELYNKVLPSARALFGQLDDRTLRIEAALVVANSRQDRVREANRLFESLSIKLHTLIDECKQPSTLKRRKHLLQVLQTITAAVSAPSNSKPIEVLSQLSQVCLSLGQYQESYGYAARSLELLDKIPGADPVMLGQANANLAWALFYCGQKDKAAIRFGKAVEILEKYPESKPSRSLDALCFGWGLAYLDQKKYLEAELPFTRCYNLRKLNPSDPKALQAVVTQLLLVYCNRGEFAKSEPFAKEHVKLSIELEGLTGSETRSNIAWLAQIYKAQHKPAQVESLYRNYLKDLKRAAAPTSIAAAELAKFYVENGQEQEAEQLCKWQLSQKRNDIESEKLLHNLLSTIQKHRR